MITTSPHLFLSVTPTPEIYTLSLHDALPISASSHTGFETVFASRFFLFAERPSAALSEIGRASCRERVEFSVVAGTLKKKNKALAKRRQELYPGAEASPPER